MQTSSTSSTNLNVLVKSNGEDKIIPENTTILKLLYEYKINKDRVVIELNQKILNKKEFDLTTIKKNDEVEIVTFVGGG